MKIVQNANDLGQTAISTSHTGSAALQLIDKINLITQLSKVAILAAAGFEDSEQRDALTALFLCMNDKLAECVDDLQDNFVQERT